MLMCTSWKARSLSPEQWGRMMETWGKLEAELAEHPGMNRHCWYLFSDGSGGFAVSEVADEEAARAFGLELHLALAEFLELDLRPVHDLESAMGPIMAASERISVN